MAAEFSVRCLRKGKSKTCLTVCTPITNLSLTSTSTFASYVCNNTEAKIKTPKWKSRCCLDRVTLVLS